MIAGNYFKVRKTAKIRKRYNQVPHLTQDTTRGSNKNTQNEDDLLHIDQLAIAFKVTVPTEDFMLFKGEIHQSFVFVCPLCTLVKFVRFLSSSSFGNTIRGSNSLDPDQARHFITNTYNTVVIPLRQFGSRQPLRCYS